MSSNRLLGLALALSAAVAAPAASGQEAGQDPLPVGARIAGIQITSDWEPLVSPAYVAVSDLRVGEPYSIPAMRRALQNLYALGTVADVRVAAREAPNGLLLELEVVPQILFWDVHFAGDLPWSRGTARRALSLREGMALDPPTVSAQARRLEAALADDGYLLAAVTGAVVEGSTPARGVLELHTVAGDRAVLGSARISGDGGISDNDLAAALALPAGTPYEPAEFEIGLERVRERLLASNYFFHDIRVVEQSLDLRDNSMSVEIEVTVGPRVDLDVGSIPFKPGEMRQRLAIFEFGTVEDWALKDTRHEIVRWLQERGHWRPLVSYTRQRDEVGRNTTVRFRVLAGQKAKLARVEVRGNAVVSADELLAAIRTEPAAFLAPRRYVDEIWEADLRAITTVYRRRGFLEATVVGSDVYFDDDVGGLVARVEVAEGPQTFVAATRVVVDTESTAARPEELLDSLLQREGAPYDPTAVRRDTDRLRALLANMGFPRALVATTETPDPDGLVIEHEIYLGDQQRVARVLVAGNESTRAEVIEREYAFTPGGPFSFADQLETQSRLYATGLFSQVDVEPALADDLAEEQSMVVRVQEAPPLFITYGAGYDTEEKVRGTFTIGHNNVGGRNQQLSFSTRASVREQRFRVLFREPYFLGRRAEGTATAFYTNEAQTSFSIQRYGLSLQLLFQHSDHVASLPRLLFRDTTTFDIEIDPDFIRPEDQSTRVGALSYSVIVDTRSNPIEPADGFYGTNDVEIATKLLGSNTNFATLLTRWFAYRAINERLTFAVGLRAGIKIPYGGSDLVPLPERFFAGGSTTLRGFRLDGAGPVDDNGNPLGGRILLISNLELRARLWGDLGGVAFADIGNVFALPETVRWREVRETLGLGIRYATPVGPIRFDVARLMDRREGEDRYQLFFSIGHTF